MTRAGLTALGWALSFGAWAAPADAATAALTAVDAMELRYGVNDIPGFMPDGRAATVVMAHRESAAIGGYDVYLVYVADARRRGNAPGMPELVELPSAAGVPSDLVRNELTGGDASIDALCFVRAQRDGRPVTALVQARRRIADAARPTDPAPVDLNVWQLDGRAEASGHVKYAFLPVSHAVTTRRYCSATSALHSELGIAFPDGWDASERVDGCASAGETARGAAGQQMLRLIDATSFPNSTGPRRQADRKTFADYGFTQIESFPDGWSFASEADRSWTVGLLVLDDGPQRKLLCVTETARDGTYRSTAVVEAAPSTDGLWHATGRTVVRPDCAVR